MKRSSVYRFLIVLCLAALMAGCGPSGALLPAGAQVAQSALPRVANPQVAPADQAQLAAGNRAFAMDLYQHLRTQDGNLVFSPYSISLALAMTYAGARGETAQQMASVLHFDLPPERLHPAFNALDQSLAQPTNDVTPIAHGKANPQLNIANSLWAQQGFTFLPAFLDLEAQNYGAGVRLVDYTEHTEAARQAINGWVSDRTQAKIPELFKPGILDSDTRLMLANAVYFKADWMQAFDPNETKPGDFHLLDGTIVSPPMMSTHQAGQSYARGDYYQAVGLLYANSKIEMVILLPDPGQFTAFETGLSVDRLEAILGNMQPSMVDMVLPRIKSQTGLDLEKILVRMGMPDAFEKDKADFSGIDGRKDLLIKKASHQAYLTVNEEGTEATAATSIDVIIITEHPKVQVDRPFIYLVYDKKSGTILFIGRVLNPLS